MVAVKETVVAAAVAPLVAVWLVRWEGSRPNTNPDTVLAAAKRGIAGSVATSDATFDFYCPASDETSATNAARALASSQNITLATPDPVSVVNVFTPGA